MSKDGADVDQALRASSVLHTVHMAAVVRVDVHTAHVHIATRLLLTVRRARSQC